MPHDENMPIDVWCDKVVQDAREQSEKAMQLGTDIHADIERWLSEWVVKGNCCEIKYSDYWNPMFEEMKRRDMINCSRIHPEKSFAHPLGFGGKIDFYNDEYLIDFKTSAFNEEKIKKGLAWPEHAYQLGAYRYGIGKPDLKCMNIFISTTVPGLFHFHEWTEEEIKNGTQIFLQTLNLWKLVKGV
jgi:hypothetical protein